MIALLDKVLSDSQAIEKESVSDETQSQANYESFVADSNASIAALNKEIAANTENVSVRKSDKQSAKGSLDSTEAELEALGNYKEDLHQSCDFVMKNFEVRQQAMKQEIEAISEAKAILSGMK